MKAMGEKSPFADPSAVLGRLQNDSAGFEKLAQLLKSWTGINLPLNPKNLSLMASRLNPILRDRGLDRYEDLYRLLGEDSDLRTEFIHAMTTNTTHFFREPQHFEFLTAGLKKRLQADPTLGRTRPFRVWCAASSTGQEPYTILISVLEAANSGPALNLLDSSPNLQVKMLATDIDLDVLAKAASAKYTEREIEGIRPDLLAKYFDAAIDGGQRVFKVKPRFRDLIRFAQLNLMDEVYPFKQPFDVIFCRNVLIYFDPETTRRTIEKLASHLKPDGWLFLGHSESGMMRSPLLKAVSGAVYTRA